MTTFSIKRREELAKRIMEVEQEEVLDQLENFLYIIMSKEEIPGVPSAEIDNGVLLVSKELDKEINEAISEQQQGESISLNAFKKEFAPWLEA